jgi:putative OPT family oligopeptide transporter
MAAWLLAPAIVLFGSGLDTPLFPADKLIRDMTPDEIRGSYVLYIGAGAVAAGGIISMLQSMPTILSSILSGLRDISEKGSRGGGMLAVPRTDRDLSMRVVLLGSLGIILAIWAAPMLEMNLLGALCIVLFGFLFVTVSARLTGEIGSSSNPISGMTVATLLMTCLIFLLLGWTSSDHKLQALSVAAVVCIAASNAGSTAQCLKTGHLLGGTPRNMQLAILVGALTSALVIGWTLIILNDGGTVYSRKDLPTVKFPLTGEEEKERVRGDYAVDDSKEYAAIHASVGEFEGVPHRRDRHGSLPR